MVTRDEIITQAKRTIAALPKWHRDALKREFDRAEAEAAWIVRGGPHGQH